MDELFGVAGVWLVIFNADLLLRIVVAAFGRIRGLPPVLKTAVKYPTQSLFRTGMTLAMFMLVVFTLTAMNFIQAAMGAGSGRYSCLYGASGNLVFGPHTCRRDPCGKERPCTR